MITNKIKYIAVFICGLFVTTACNDQLDTEPQGIYTNTTFYQTEAHAIFTVNAVYEITAFSTIKNSLWVFGDVASDDAIKGGNPGDQSDINFINDFNTNPDNGFVEGIWKQYYEGITRANKTIFYVPSIEMDDELKERIVGEAKFLRAYFYFHLVNIFGEIPLKTVPAFSPDELQVPTSSVSEIYAQIETDLSEASEVLPESFSGSELGRATKGAALALYAKVLLFQEKWDQALDQVTQVEGLGYSLMPVYGQNFQLPFENNSESIFEIQHLAEQNPFTGSSLNQWFSPFDESGYFFNAPTQDFVDEFEVTAGDVVDPRLDYTVGREGQKWLNGEDFNPEWSPSTGYLVKKHSQPLSEVGKGRKGDGDLNYTFMRYAEILLIKAEVLNELGRSAEALFPLNEVRTRARESYLFDPELPGSGTIPDNLLPDITSTNASTLRDAIRHERRVELGMEFHRFFDLMRYGKTVAERALSDTNFNYDQTRYFPIPQSEKDTNKAITN